MFDPENATHERKIQNAVLRVQQAIAHAAESCGVTVEEFERLRSEHFGRTAKIDPAD